MATVTGMTAAAMLAIRDGTVVTGHFDSASHLILTRYDGTLVDAGVVLSATTGQAGVVELATNAETQSGTDTVRAVTPAGLASLPGYRVQILAQNAIAETALPSSWPSGVSLMSCSTGSGWSLNNGFGTVMTSNASTDRTTQTFWAANGGSVNAQMWVRSYHSTTGGGGWTAWVQSNGAVSLDPAAFTQATALASYPTGLSRMYYTTGNSTSWDFSGLTGEVSTYKSGTNFGRQTFVQHAWGSSNTPEMWQRTSDGTIGWSAWKKLIHDPGAWLSYTPTWSTQSGSATPSLGNAILACRYQKIARTCNVKFFIQFGSTTNFGASPSGTDNWQFSLPPSILAANAADDGLGFLEMYQSATNYGMGRVKLYSTSGFRLGVSAGSSSGVGGDADSVTPFTWANGNYLRGMFTYETAS